MQAQPQIFSPLHIHWPEFRDITPSLIMPGDGHVQPRKEGHFPVSYFVQPQDLCTILLSSVDLGSRVTSSGSNTKGGLGDWPQGHLHLPW